MSPLVSIVVANYNYGRYLGEAIESALAQTYRDVEVVVVDDGSNDDSLAVARRYPVRVVAQANSGVARARNRGAAEAKGDLLVFLDADDALEPTFVERCWAVLSISKRDVAYAYTQMALFGDETSIFALREFDGPSLVKHNFVPVTTLLHRKPFEQVGGFDPRWTAYEDWELWIRLWGHGFCGVHVREPLLRYRRHGSTRNRIELEDAKKILWRVRAANPRASWRMWAQSPLKIARALREIRGHEVGKPGRS